MSEYLTVEQLMEDINKALTPPKLDKQAIKEKLLEKAKQSTQSNPTMRQNYQPKQTSSMKAPVPNQASTMADEPETTQSGEQLWL